MTAVILGLFFLTSGVIKVEVNCYRKSDSTKVSSLLCDAAIKPKAVATKECMIAPCEKQYSWVVEFSNCSKKCGKGKYILCYSERK